MGAGALAKRQQESAQRKADAEFEARKYRAHAIEVLQKAAKDPDNELPKLIAYTSEEVETLQTEWSVAMSPQQRRRLLHQATAVHLYFCALDENHPVMSQKKCAELAARRSFTGFTGRTIYEWSLEVKIILGY